MITRYRSDTQETIAFLMVTMSIVCAMLENHTPTFGSYIPYGILLLIGGCYYSFLQAQKRTTAKCMQLFAEMTLSRDQLDKISTGFMDTTILRSSGYEFEFFEGTIWTIKNIVADDELSKQESDSARGDSATAKA